MKKELTRRKPFMSHAGGLFFVLPSIITVIIFVYGMIAWTFNVSLTNKNSVGVKTIEYVGFKNYTDLIHDDRFTHSLSNLVKFTVVVMLGTLITGFIMALLLERGIKGEGFFRSFYLGSISLDCRRGHHNQKSRECLNHVAFDSNNN